METQTKGETQNKDKAKVSLPPERNFFDKPVGIFKGAWVWFKQLSWTWRIAILALGFLFAFMFSIRGCLHEKPKAKEIPQEEKRLIKNREMIDQAIKEGQTKEAPVSASKREERPRAKRNYSSPMAVYVLDKEKEKNTSSLENRQLREETRKLGLPSGTKIDALFPNQIFSFNVEAPVIAHTPKDILWKENVVIPKDSKFFGSVNILKSLDRINVNFTKLILPDGREIRIRAIALSQDGSAGVKGKVEKHQDKKIFKAIGEALIGTASIVSGGFNRDPYSLQDELRVNMAQGLTNQAREDLRNVRIDTSITVPAYTPIQIMLLESV